MLIYEAKEKRMSFLKFKLRPMFTEPARAKELRREIIPLPKETSPPSTALHSHRLFAAYGTVFRQRGLSLPQKSKVGARSQCLAEDLRATPDSACSGSAY